MRRPRMHSAQRRMHHPGRHEGAQRQLARKEYFPDAVLLFETWVLLGGVLAAPVFASSVVAIPLMVDRPSLSMWAAVALVWPLCGQAAAPEVPDPNAWARLTPSEQADRRADLKRQLQQATPQERAAFRSRLRERLEDMTPEQRQALAAKTRERWQTLDPSERQRLLDERRRVGAFLARGADGDEADPGADLRG